MTLTARLERKYGVRPDAVVGRGNAVASRAALRAGIETVVARSIHAPSMLARFMAKIDQSGPDECWLWIGGRDPGGYGTFHAAGAVKAHRFSYEFFVGLVPFGLELDHLCSVRACVNPRHLEPVTKAENARRSILRNGPQSLCKRGHSLEDAYRISGTTRAGNEYVRRQCRQCTSLRGKGVLS